MNEKIVAPSSANLAHAAQLLKKGLLVALPTETVYGLGADAANAQAVAAMFVAKGRPADHPVIVHIGHDPSRKNILDWAAEWPPLAETLARAFWPGPLTLIVKRHPQVTPLVSGGQDTIGLRCPAHPVAQALLQAFAAIGSGGIAAPSANRFGQLSPTCPEHVAHTLHQEVACILDGGACDIGIESTIIDVSRGHPVLLRPGQISVTQIERVTGMPVSQPDQQAPRASGMLASHYAPRTKLEVLPGKALEKCLKALLRTASRQRIAVYAYSLPTVAHADISWLSAPAECAQYAHNLYAALHTLDALEGDLILCESVPETPEWAGVADRLQRAAHTEIGRAPQP